MRCVPILLVVVFFVLLAAAAACGPSVSEMRLVPSPARAPDCELKFIALEASQLQMSGEWALLGYVTLSESGVADPFSEEYRAIVRPRACAMGGEAVTLLQATTVEQGLGSSSGTAYAVLRARGTGAPAVTPF